MLKEKMKHLQEAVNIVSKINFGDHNKVIKIKSDLDEMMLELQDLEAILKLRSFGISSDIMSRFNAINMGLSHHILRKIKSLGWENVADIINISVDKNMEYDKAMVELFIARKNFFETGDTSKITAKVKRRGAPTKEDRMQKQIDNLDSDRKKMEEERITNNFELLTKENELLKKEIELLKSSDVIIKGEPIFGYQAPVLDQNVKLDTPNITDLIVTCECKSPISYNPSKHNTIETHVNTGLGAKSLK